MRGDYPRRAHLCKLFEFACATGHAPLKKEERIASYHLHVKTVSRSAGRSATAAAAYRAGARIVDERTGELHDYRRRGGVEHAQIVLPSDAPAWAGERSALWNAAEAAERRKNSVVAREFEVALPHELPAAARRALALEFAGELAERHGAAADVAVHAPGKAGDMRNHHAHILLTTRRLSADGLTEKTRELDDARSGEVKRWRERWADLQNERLREHGVSERVDHRTLADRGVGRAAQVHLGPKAAAMQRRGADTDRGRLSAEAGQRRASALERMSDKQLRAAIRSMDLPDPERFTRTNTHVAALAASARAASRAAASGQREAEDRPTRRDAMAPAAPGAGVVAGSGRGRRRGGGSRAPGPRAGRGPSCGAVGAAHPRLAAGTPPTQGRHRGVPGGAAGQARGDAVGVAGAPARAGCTALPGARNAPRPRPRPGTLSGRHRNAVQRRKRSVWLEMAIFGRIGRKTTAVRGRLRGAKGPRQPWCMGRFRSTPGWAPGRAERYSGRRRGTARRHHAERYD